MKIMLVNKRMMCLLHGLAPMLFSISVITLLWTSQSIYTTATYYTGYFASLPVRLAWKFNGDFELNCHNLVVNRGPGSISFSFWIRKYLIANRDPLKRDKRADAEIKCALQNIYHNKQHSLALIAYKHWQ